MRGLRHILLIISTVLICGGCEERPHRSDERTLYLSSSGKIDTLDPALAADLLSQYMVASFYDTLLQYDYAARPYKLIPAMLESMPVISADMTSYTLTLKKNLRFADNPCFDGDESLRQITSKDVEYSILRIADARLHSPVFWMFRGKIKGIDQFRQITSAAAANDFSMYASGCEGIEIINDHTLILHLNYPDPRMSYALALPAAGIVSKTAVQFYGQDFQANPVGSGPFKLVEWIRDFRIILERNPDFRHETWPQAENPADRDRPLPLADKIVCYLIKQPLAGWLMFLQGGLDFSNIAQDTFDAVVGEDRQLVKTLRDRGIQMLQVPEFQVRYVGFNFSDPMFADNLNLRKAISLAYNVPLREKHFNYQMIPANSVIPPGVAGHPDGEKNPYGQFNIELAKEYLRKAGYPDGVDPSTGRPLELTFDQGGSSPEYRQISELMVEDMKKIGIKIIPVMNNWPRFLDKLRKGQFQLFRLSWVGDYPDAENFLQLFYGKNAGSSNRILHNNPEYDRMFEEILHMPDSPERTLKYRRMSDWLNDNCLWILEGYPISFQLIHSWTQNYLPHDFAFCRWKYLSVDSAKRRAMIKSFKPVNMSELRK